MTRPIRTEGIRAQRIGDELFLHGADGETLTVLNATAMMIWSLCDGDHDVAAMTEVLADIHPETDRGNLAADIETCLGQFKRDGLIQP